MYCHIRKHSQGLPSLTNAEMNQKGLCFFIKSSQSRDDISMKTDVSKFNLIPQMGEGSIRGLCFSFTYYRWLPQSKAPGRNS